MEKILYLDCSSGISGDMVVGALLDLGASREALLKALDSLGLAGYRLHFGRVKKCGIDAYDFDVRLEEADGAMDGPADGQHQHNHQEGHVHFHRNLSQIFHIIGHLEAREQVKAVSRKIFQIVAEAESKAHGIPVEQVHFHEVGAVDSIIDIIGTAVCLDNLGIGQVVLSPLAEGRGYVKCQHGVMAVPVPATANIAAAYGLALRFTDNEGEMVTPTGAAIGAALSGKGELPERFQIEKIGIGAGNKDFKHANILRAMLVSPVDQPSGQMWKLEANLDDCTGEALGFAMERLLSAGAADAWFTPIYMKKNRPAYTLSWLCREDQAEELEDLVFAHTTTIGIRKARVERTVLKRRQVAVATGYGQAMAKVCSHKGRDYCYPEYQDVCRICLDTGLDFQQVYHQVKELAEKTCTEDDSCRKAKR